MKITLKAHVLAVFAALRLAAVPFAALCSCVAVTTSFSAAVAAQEVAAQETPTQEAPGATDDRKLAPRETAALAKKGTWSVGIFNPVEYALSDTMAIRAYPFPVLRPVTLDVRVGHMTGKWTVTGEYGLELAGLGNFGAMPLGIKGDLVPSCKVAAHGPDTETSCQAPGFTVAPRAGIVASMGEDHVFTGRLDVAVGIPLGEPGQPLDAFPNLDLAWAASNNGWRARVGGRYDRLVTNSIRWASELNVFMVAPQSAEGSATARSPLTLSAWTGIDIGVGDSSRFTIGVIYYNSDQRRTEMVDQGGYSTREPVRSHDLYPTIDFIF